MRRVMILASLLALVIGGSSVSAAPRVFSVRYDTPMLGIADLLPEPVGDAGCGQSIVGEICVPYQEDDTRVLFEIEDDVSPRVELSVSIWWRECEGDGCRGFQSHLRGCGSLNVILPPLLTRLNVRILPVGYGSTLACAGAVATSGEVTARFF